MPLRPPGPTPSPLAAASSLPKGPTPDLLSRQLSCGVLLLPEEETRSKSCSASWPCPWHQRSQPYFPCTTPFSRLPGPPLFVSYLLLPIDPLWASCRALELLPSRLSFRHRQPRHVVCLVDRCIEKVIDQAKGNTQAWTCPRTIGATTKARRAIRRTSRARRGMTEYSRPRFKNTKKRDTPLQGHKQFRNNVPLTRNSETFGHFPGFKGHNKDSNTTVSFERGRLYSGSCLTL